MKKKEETKSKKRKRVMGEKKAAHKKGPCLERKRVEKELATFSFE